MKFLLCFFLFCAVTIAKPFNDGQKSEDSDALLNEKLELDAQESSPIVTSVETSKKDEPQETKIDSNRANDKSRNTYPSIVNQEQVNPNVHASQLTSIHNTDSNSSERSVADDYGSAASKYLSTLPNGLGSNSYVPLHTSGLTVPSHPTVINRLRSQPCGHLGQTGLSQSYYGLHGLQGSYGSNGLSGSYGFHGLPEPYYGLHGLSGSYGLNGLSGSYGLHRLTGSLDQGSIHASVIPTSLSSYIPHHGGVNIVKQIIHKPIITELQEVIHKPIIYEEQEIVNKPVISEVQQVIHKPLYVEHIGLGPSYHGYQKHTVKQPVYQKPNQHIVHQPISQAGTVHLADEYEHAVSTTTTTHGVCEPGTGSLYGLTGSKLGVLQPSALYKALTPNVANYGPSVSASYSPLAHISTPYSTGYLNPASLSSQGYNLGNTYGQQTALFRSNYEETNKHTGGKSQPKSSEQVTYDDVQPYKQSQNDDQQTNDPFQQQFIGFEQQLGRHSEDPRQIKIDVDAITDKIKKNPDMMKQLFQIISESMNVSNQKALTNQKIQDKYSRTLPPLKSD